MSDATSCGHEGYATAETPQMGEAAREVAKYRLVGPLHGAGSAKLL